MTDGDATVVEEVKGLLGKTQQHALQPYAFKVRLLVFLSLIVRSFPHKHAVTLVTDSLTG